MLTERNSTLCLKCHFQDQAGLAAFGSISNRSQCTQRRPRSRGTCWTAGCHEGVHGSNASNHLRY